MKQLLDGLASGRSLDTPQAEKVFETIMTGSATPAQVAALLSLIQLRGPTVQEILGGARVMRRKVRSVTVPEGLTAVDTCGTGADHAQTFNISTAAAIVAAAAGRPRGMVIAKHGNRSVTSQSGSSQVLEALGVKLSVGDATLTRCLDEVGLCFCFAPAHHPAMKHVARVRQELGFKTLFNLLGPLTNPAATTRQVLGVFSPDLTEPMAQVLTALNAKHAMVVHGRYGQEPEPMGGLDELTMTGINYVSHLRDGSISNYQLETTSLGIKRAHIETLRVNDPESSAGVIRAVLSGQPGPARDIVCLNAAAALVVGDVATDLAQGIQLAEQAIDCQAAVITLQGLAEMTHADHSQPS